MTQAAEHFQDDLKIAFIAVDCTKHKQICEQYNVKGFPSIIYFSNFGKQSQPYEGGREAKDFIKFMNNPNDPNAGKPDQRDDWLDIPGNEDVHLLDDSNFDEFIKDKEQVLVLFYAPCKFIEFLFKNCIIYYSIYQIIYVKMIFKLI